MKPQTDGPLEGVRVDLQAITEQDALVSTAVSLKRIDAIYDAVNNVLHHR
jgi:hypothetical protein